MIICVRHANAMSAGSKQMRLLAMAILLGVSGGWCMERPEGGTHSYSAQTAFNKGVQQFNAHAFEKAIPHFDDALEHDADFAMAYYARGACYRELHRNDKALSDLNDAIRLYPTLLDAHSLRGVIRYDGQQVDAALEDFNYVLERRPRDAQSLLSRGLLYFNQDRIEPAKDDFRIFLKLYPSDPIAPRLRKLLASLTPGRKVPSAPVTEVPAGRPPSPSPNSQQLAAELLLNAHELSETYNQKVIRGERAQAVGTLQGSEIPFNKE